MRQVARLKRRADFVALRKGNKAVRKGFVIQAATRRSPACVEGARIGFTVTKKVGNAVERSRIRRRLRELIRVTPNLAIQCNVDYVLIGRRAALDMPFGDLQSDLNSAMRAIARRLT